MATHPWWRIGWRNLGRNRRRTALTAVGLAVGYTSVVAIAGLTDGLTSEMVDTATGIITGQVEIHAPAYLPDRSVYETIGGDAGTDVAALLDAATADPAVTGAAPRVYAGGLISSGAATVGAMLVGVDPAREPTVTRLPAAVREGHFPEAGKHELLIGRGMATQLGVAPGAELVLVAPAADGSLGNDLFTVSGVFESGMQDLDQGYALLPLDVLQELLALAPGRIHEVALRVNDPWLAPAVAERVGARLRGAGGAPLLVQPWTVLRPELVDYAQLAKSSLWIVLVVIFAMAIFGVANTLLMATFERRYEFALLLALGAAPRGIVRAILTEAVALGVFSIALGVLTSVPLIAWLHHAPLDLSRFVGGFTMAGALVRPLLRADYPTAMFFSAGATLLATTLLASLYPAFRATRIPPADTLQGR
jgi:ABC-type lipoprotein release transport system permease subunit